MELIGSLYLPLKIAPIRIDNDFNLKIEKLPNFKKLSIYQLTKSPNFDVTNSKLF